MQVIYLKEHSNLKKYNINSNNLKELHWQELVYLSL